MVYLSLRVYKLLLKITFPMEKNEQKFYFWNLTIALYIVFFLVFKKGRFACVNLYVVLPGPQSCKIPASHTCCYHHSEVPAHVCPEKMLQTQAGCCSGHAVHPQGIHGQTTVQSGEKKPYVLLHSHTFFNIFASVTKTANNTVRLSKWLKN